METQHTPGPWTVNKFDGKSIIAQHNCIALCETDAVSEDQERANARLIASAPEQNATLNYVADMTYCGADGEWHLKPGYDPQRVLDALAKATP